MLFSKLWFCTEARKRTKGAVAPTGRRPQPVRSLLPTAIALLPNRLALESKSCLERTAPRRPASAPYRLPAGTGTGSGAGTTGVLATLGAVGVVLGTTFRNNGRNSDQRSMSIRARALPVFSWCS